MHAQVAQNRGSQNRATKSMLASAALPLVRYAATAKPERRLPSRHR
jgi:hypothetical protein